MASEEDLSEYNSFKISRLLCLGVSEVVFVLTVLRLM